jgi:hypothetical protein
LGTENAFGEMIASLFFAGSARRLGGGLLKKLAGRTPVLPGCLSAAQPRFLGKFAPENQSVR